MTTQIVEAQKRENAFRKVLKLKPQNVCLNVCLKIWIKLLILAAKSVWQTDLDKADKRLCAQNLVLITVYRPTCLPNFFSLTHPLTSQLHLC